MDETLLQAWLSVVDAHHADIALFTTGQRWTYSALGRLVGTLAAALVSQHVHTCIGIWLPRDVTLIVAILASISINVPVLLLDRDTPVARVEKLLRRFGCPFVLSQPSSSGCDAAAAFIGMLCMTL